MADSGAEIVKTDEGKNVARRRADVQTERIATQLTEVVGELKSVVEAESERSKAVAEAQLKAAETTAEAQKQAIEAIKKPKRIIRENGKIVGIAPVDK
jgi:regulator of protease activity HflC (stomatin/prohibitin superfamily)